MIRESEHFSFDGIKSTNFDIRNVHIEERGLYRESLTANKTVNEIQIDGRDKPYFLSVTEEPKTIQLKFAFTKRWDDDLIDRVVRWLNVREYKPLFFSGDIDRVFYVLPVEGIEKIHNGLKDGYLVLTMRCDSGRSYSHDIFTSEYNTEELSGRQETKLPTITLGNHGHFDVFPDIWIEKISDGNLSIYNKSNGNELFEFENIDVGEKLFINCENEIINTDKKNTYRYDDFNDNFLRLVYGENVIAMSNNMKIRFRYRNIFS